jgi:glycosyltransferase involved in cell wall biosynthesis
VRVVGVARSHETATGTEADGAVSIWRLPEPRMRGGWIGARVRLFRTVAGWARARQIDLIEVPDWQGWAAGWPALPTPVVARLHGSTTYFAREMGGAPRMVTRVLERASLARADFSCSVSRYTAERTRAIFGLPRHADAVLQNPVDVPNGNTSEPRSAADVVFAGTLTAKKGVASLVDAWPAVVRACPTAHLHIYGKDGRTSTGASMRAFLEQRLGHEARASVAFYGHRHRAEVLSALRRARVAVFPSFAEACAMAPLEAMACGCPTISSVRGSGPELFEDGRDGLLVDPGDPRAIATAITRVLTDDALARRLGTAGNRHARTAFSLEGRLAANIAFYQQCVERFSTRSNIARRHHVSLSPA